MRLLAIMILSATSFPLLAADDYRKPQSPSEVHELFGEYFRSKDLLGLSTLFHKDAVLILDSKGKIAKGKEAIKQSLSSYLQGELEMTTHSVSIHVNGNTALVQSDWEIKDGPKGTAVEVMTYVDGGWLYIIDNPYGY
ncbi:hypothetical protein TUMSATVNIG1_47450 [Vibrio nigripulchritudo]|uniref:YybH family protein n=1 Tax=Vibrio nigripulchritudo TaxID=28173 RepID=UPI00190D4A4E|nr:DUF4440 domain-containing protein [Vibrio nigripulchritudo]BCL72774.1 hypothetical protein VNTUMSATTG_47110 [Vibrio nigripulchritudo]BDU34136.1 hypothetical protein TUMSATVNIG1_47450 [Vibrio nigripulchritudo]